MEKLKNEERTFFFSFFFFCFSLFKTTKICLGSTKMKIVYRSFFKPQKFVLGLYQNGNFLPGKSISRQEKNQEKLLCPLIKSQNHICMLDSYQQMTAFDLTVSETYCLACTIYGLRHNKITGPVFFIFMVDNSFQVSEIKWESKELISWVT